MWREMQSSKRFKVTAWLLPYNYKSESISSFYYQKHKDLLEENGVEWVEWHPDLTLHAGQFDAVIFTVPYDRERPKELRFNQVRSKVKKIIYIPYCLAVESSSKLLRLQFSQPIHLGADLIVARSEAEKKLYKRYCSNVSGRVRAIGHPRFDYYLNAVKKLNIDSLKKRIDGRLAVLWNSHFSFSHKFSQSSCLSTFDILGPDIFEYFKKNSSWLCLIWRPHPALFSELFDQKIITISQYELLKKELERLGIILDENTSHFPAFLASDALLTDPGTFLFEYLATTKPMLPLINPEGEPLNDEVNSLLMTSGYASDFLAVKKFLLRLAKGEICTEFYVGLKNQYLPMLDGQAGRRLCSALVEGDFECSSSLGSFSELISDSVKPKYCVMVTEGVEFTSHETPVLNRIIHRLRCIAEEKKKQSQYRKRFRRIVNSLRTLVVEEVKKRL